MNNAQINALTKKDVPAGHLSPEQVAGWLAEIDGQKRKQKDWREGAKKIVDLYEGYKAVASPFNILYSNTDTLLPALYNNTPRPAVGRRFKDADPLGAAVSMTLNRTLSFTMDTNNGDEPEFDILAQHAILQALVPGQGVVRFKYVAEYDEAGGVQETLQQPVKDIPQTPAEGEAAQEVGEEPENLPITVIPKVTNERVCGETVEYDRFLMGFARKWSQVPWISFEHHMTRDEVEENFGKALTDATTFSELDESDTGSNSETKDTRKVAVVYELWNRADKTVFFVSPNFKDREYKLVEDPLGISGFFPCDEPLVFLPKISSMVPQPLYELYRKQAEELNLITNRITAIMQCLKVRGVYDSALTEILEVMKLEDGELKAIDNVQQLGDGKKLSDAIFLMPLAELVSVLQQLYLQRTQIKTVIYEITGISDIIRGSSVASETATAQQIKNQWGTLRLKKMQKAVSKWCRNNCRIIAEIASKKFSVETFERMTGLPYVTKQQHDQAQMQMQQFQAQQQQAAMQAQQQAAVQAQQAQATGQQVPPMQPPAPQPPPQQLVDTLATPVWEDIVALMRDTVGVEFRVDIETNSTIADDMAEDQKNIGELLNALSQFLNGVAPLIQNGAMPFEVAKTMMLGIVRKMAMGPEVEDQLEKMQAPTPPAAEQPPAPPPPDPNIQLKQQAEAATLQLQMQQQQQQAQMAQQEFALREQEFQMKMKENQQKEQMNAAKFQQQMLMLKAKTETALAVPTGA